MSRSFFLNDELQRQPFKLIKLVSGANPLFASHFSAFIIEHAPS